MLPTVRTLPNLPTLEEWTCSDAEHAEVVAAEGVNFRAGPALDTKIITVLQPGRILMCYYRIGDWICCQPANLTPPVVGYVFFAYVSAVPYEHVPPPALCRAT